MILRVGIAYLDAVAMTLVHGLLAASDGQVSDYKLSTSHTQRQTSFRNLIKSTRNQIVFTILRLIWNRTDVRLDPNQLENGKYNLISD